MDLARKLRNYDLITELDISGISFSKQLKKANKLNSKSIILIGDDEALKNHFIIRLFNEESSENMEETILLDDVMKLENWLNKNLFVDKG